MRKGLLMACLLVGITGSVSAQRDDLYFVPKKKKAVKEVRAYQTSSQKEDWQMEAEAASIAPAKQLGMDEDAYNRRGSYRIEQDATIDAESIVVITEEGDTMRMDTDTLRLARVADGEGWVNGFEGSDSDYEYAMRIVRFRNPRYAIPVSSPLYWDVVYGGTLWPSWEWNIYDDGMYAYVFPTSSNWYYWDYMMSYPFGWSAWSNPWAYHHGFHWGHHWGNYYAHVWYDPCFGPGWHYGHHHGHHHGFYPGLGKPSWRQPKAHPNYRSAMAATTRRSGQTGNVAPQRIDNGSSRNVSSRSAIGRTGTVSRSSSTASSSRSSSRAAVGDDVIRRSTGSSSVSRSTSNGSSRSNSSYSRPSSTRSSSSSVSRSSSSSSSRSGSYSSGSSSSSRSSSYSSGGSSRSSSYSSGGGSRSSGSSSRSSGSRR